MKVKVEKTKSEVVDVELPLFRKSIIDSDTHPETTLYERIDLLPEPIGERRLRSITLTFRRDWHDVERTVEVTIATNYAFDARDRDFILGTGNYQAITGEDFATALADAKALLAEASE